MRPHALLAALALPAAPLAAQSERVTLTNDAQVYSPAGQVQVVAGDGGAVVVDVTRGGRDGAQLRLNRVDGGRTLAVAAPGRELVYPRMGRWSNTSFDVRDDGTFGGGRQLRISGRGDGPEAWADLVVRVPRGGRLKLNLGAGEIAVTNVDGDLTLGTNGGDVRAERTRGRLTVGTGSGDVRVRDVQGDQLKVGTGSGDADVQGVRAERVEIGSGSGDLEGGEIAGGEVKLGTGSGDLRLGRVVARRVDAGTGSGDVGIELARGVEDARVSTGSGGVTLRLASDLGATLDVSTGSGGIRTSVPVQVTRQERDRLNGTVGDGRARVRVSTGSGSVRIEGAR